MVGNNSANKVGAVVLLVLSIGVASIDHPFLAAFLLMLAAIGATR